MIPIYEVHMHTDEEVIPLRRITLRYVGISRENAISDAKSLYPEYKVLHLRLYWT